MFTCSQSYQTLISSFFRFSLFSLSVCSIGKYCQCIKIAKLRRKKQEKFPFNEEKSLVGLNPVQTNNHFVVQKEGARKSQLTTTSEMCYELFNAGLIRLSSQIKITLLVKIQCKQHQNLHVQIVYKHNMTCYKVLVGGGAQGLIQDMVRIDLLKLKRQVIIMNDKQLPNICFFTTLYISVLVVCYQILFWRQSITMF